MPRLCRVRGEIPGVCFSLLLGFAGATAARGGVGTVAFPPKARS